MQYLGGKYRIAGQLAGVIVRAGEGRSRYLEPFLGGAAVFERVAPHFAYAVGCDVVEDLVLMWQAALDGWKPPVTLSEEEYAALRSAEPSALRGFAGFGCSFGGKWFGGYARSRNGAAPGYDYAAAAARSVTKTVAKCGHARVVRADFRDLIVPADAVVYADPPYAGTTGYGAAGAFDSSEFWRVASSWAEGGAVVLVSEQTAPPEWVSVWAKGLPDYLRGAQTADARTEQLFTTPEIADRLKETLS